MTKSALQIARAAYQPKLPKALASGAVKAVAGAATQSVADQEAIKALFPNTYGMPLITFEAGEAVATSRYERRCNSFRWSGSGRTQCNLRFVRRYQEIEPGKQIIWFYPGSWWSGRSQLYGTDC